MNGPAPLEVHRDVVQPEWIDYNGHMNVAYYVLAFDRAVDAFFDAIGIGKDYRLSTGCSTFAVECHVTYKREVIAGDPLRFTVQIIGADEKRIHFFQTMVHAEKGFLAATCEWVSLHVNLNSRRVTAMPQGIQDRLAEIFAVHRHLPRPPEVGRYVNAPRSA